jgi:hypothetical protein
MVKEPKKLKAAGGKMRIRHNVRTKGRVSLP